MSEIISIEDCPTSDEDEVVIIEKPQDLTNNSTTSSRSRRNNNNKVLIDLTTDPLESCSSSNSDSEPLLSTQPDDLNDSTAIRKRKHKKKHKKRKKKHKRKKRQKEKSCSEQSSSSHICPAVATGYDAKLGKRRRHRQSGAALNAATQEPNPPQIPLARKRQSDVDKRKISTRGPSKVAGSSLTTSTQTPLSCIVEAFPDIDHEHAKFLLTQADMPEAETTMPIPQFPYKIMQEARISAVIQSITSKGEDGYPKAKKENGARISNFGQDNGDDIKFKYDYSSSTMTVVPYTTQQYKDECKEKLAAQFPFMSLVGLDLHLRLVNHRYYHCHTRICNGLRGLSPLKRKAEAKQEDERQQWEEEQEQLNAIENALAGQKLTQLQINSLCIENHLTTIPQKSIIPLESNYNIHIINPILKEEIQYTHNKYQEWKQTVEKNFARNNARRLSEKDGTTLECQCCYAEFARMEMVSCLAKGHLFCVDCVKRYTEERIFGYGDLGKDCGRDGSVGPFNGKVNYNNNDEGGRSAPSKNESSVSYKNEKSDYKSSGAFELSCMHTSGCSSSFSFSQLEKALPDKVLKRYNEIQASLVVKKAGLEDVLCKCPKCDLRGTLPEEEITFACPRCFYLSCRKCGRQPHAPLKCEEVKDKLETGARQKVEEAMTAARLRTCPKPSCKKKFYKVEGCNKMTCPSCGTWMCYICRREIFKHVGYRHFCQKSNCKHDGNSCSGCPLYSQDTVVDDLKSAKEAGLEAADKVEKESEEKLTLDLKKMFDL